MRLVKEIERERELRGLLTMERDEQRSAILSATFQCLERFRNSVAKREGGRKEGISKGAHSGLSELT